MYNVIPIEIGPQSEQGRHLGFLGFGQKSMMLEADYIIRLWIPPPTEFCGSSGCLKPYPIRSVFTSFKKHDQSTNSLFFII